MMPSTLINDFLSSPGMSSSEHHDDDDEAVIIVRRKTAPVNNRSIKRPAEKDAKQDNDLDEETSNSAKRSAAETVPSTKKNNEMLPGGSLDYAREVCKDYKDTGFCGFGDSCKFIHDRGEHEQVTKLNAAWEAFRDKKSVSSATSSTDLKTDRICGICKVPFTEKITILSAIPCNHLFCSTCALSSEKTKRRCQVCKAPINGQFKAAK